MERTEESIVIGADPDRIMSVIADFVQYPTWVAVAKTVTVDSYFPGEIAGELRASQVSFELDAGILKDSYTLAYQWNSDNRSVNWNLVSSDLQLAQRGVYTLIPQASGSTKVQYQLFIELRVPFIEPLKRRAEKAIIDTALWELKKRVEG